MDRFFVEELRRIGNEIQVAGNIPEKVLEVVNAYDRIICFADIAIKEGLLELEEASEELNINDESQALFFKLIELIVEGTDPNLVRDIGIYKCISMDVHAYQGLMYLMYVQGSLMIQSGDRQWVIAEMLKAMMPKFILNEIIRRENENKLPDELQREKDIADMIAGLCNEKLEISETEYPIIGETSAAFMTFSDKEIQNLLREISIGTLEVAMKGMPGKVRARIFENIAPRVAAMIAEDMIFMGPVRLRDVEEYCEEILKTIDKLGLNA